MIKNSNFLEIKELDSGFTHITEACFEEKIYG